ncbi:uncharacterized protein N7487_004010 [Penicillium crustosum]|nr:uncharacterized protein N7487_004010 [Penicillium crustosum]KAJ5409651.1 hypothetical protein N7487_004010 [Penicillium crustosum]
MKNFCNHTPIAYAVQEGHAGVVDGFLRSKRIFPKARDGYNELLFHEAVQVGKCDVVQVFLDNCVPINLRGRDGKRALHLAAADTRNFEMARLLLQNGASIKIKDSIGNTPSDRSRNPEVTMLIRNWADQAAASDPKGKKASRPPKATAAAPPEYVA